VPEVVLVGHLDYIISGFTLISYKRHQITNGARVAYTSAMRRRHVTTTIRLPEDLHERVKRVAQVERRTTNNYITLALEEAVERYEAEHPELREEGASRDT